MRSAVVTGEAESGVCLSGNAQSMAPLWPSCLPSLVGQFSQSAAASAWRRGWGGGTRKGGGSPASSQPVPPSLASAAWPSRSRREQGRQGSELSTQPPSTPASVRKGCGEPWSSTVTRWPTEHSFWRVRFPRRGLLSCDRNLQLDVRLSPAPACTRQPGPPRER